MSEHRYKLERYKSRGTKHRCPGCNSRELVRYIDTETGEYVGEDVGRCNREEKCGHHYTPAQYFEDTKPIDAEANRFGSTENYKSRNTQNTARPQSAIPQPVTIPMEVFKQSLQPDKTVEEIAEGNSFVKYLLTLFPADIVAGLIATYYIGASIRRWPAAAVFWFINSIGQIMAGQVKLFDDTGHTAEYINHEGDKKKCTDWMHSILKRRYEKHNQSLPEWLASYLLVDLKVSCFYGEHLLNLPENKTKVIAVCESPKTAIIASAYLPQFVWLACGALSYLTEERCRVFEGRKVVLYPDISNPQPGKLTTFEKWSQRAKDLSHIGHFIVSDYLETNATEEEKAAGLDIADYLTRYDYQEFTGPETAPQPQTTISLPVTYHLPMFLHFAEPELIGWQLGTFQLSDGRLYDCLFDPDHNFITDQESKLVKLVEKGYGKQFLPGTFYGDTCLLHALN